MTATTQVATEEASTKKKPTAGDKRKEEFRKRQAEIERLKQENL